MSIPTMGQKMIELEINNNICEAVGCSNEATINLAVKIGRERTIQLSLCKDCVYKFEESENVK